MNLARVGDIHDSRKLLLPALKHADVVIQLGDFAVEKFPGFASPVLIYWIDRNHEYFDQIATYQHVAAPVEWLPIVPRRAVLELGGKRFLCMGGADSVDKAIQGDTWRTAERITAAQVFRALTHQRRIDAILSHTPPQWTVQKHFDPATLETYFGLPRWWTSPSACAIEVIWQHHGCPPLHRAPMHQSVTDERGVRVLDIGEIVMLDSGDDAATRVL